jgi:hypothetical protein
MERRRAWILQTYLHMRAEDYPVKIASALPAEGIVVFIPEAESLQARRRQYTRAHWPLTLVTVRADVTEFRPPWADAEIVQNGRFADDHRSYFVPHWPQPGIIPRDPDRGTRIEHGLRRAQEFTPARITARWAEVLFEHVPALKRSPACRWAQRLPLRQGWNIATSPPSLFKLRKMDDQIYRPVGAHR